MPSPSPNLRARHPPSSPPPPKPTTPTTQLISHSDRTHISLLDILRLLTGLLLLSSSLSWFITGDSLLWGYRPALTRPSRLKAWLVHPLLPPSLQSRTKKLTQLQRGPIFLTDRELAAYDGSNPSLPIYVAINGSIYDVSVSPHFYGPGGSYSFFAGRDATRAYVTGCFQEDLTPDLRGVEEMFMSVDEDGGERETKEEKREGKLRLERERRVARKKVRDTVRGWESMFDGGKDGKYFWVGRVKREEGWEGKLGPVRELCKKAREGRPKRGATS
ncbi:MAG: hypothetical protein Q9195_008171 [Heterodermia aff. obscurata]